MGKKGGSSWLTAVKRAFRSPTKESDKRATGVGHDQEADEEKVLSFRLSFNFIY
jgi:hypothetical protein